MSRNCIQPMGVETDRSVARGRASRAGALFLSVALLASVSGCALLKSAPAPRDTFELSAPTGFANVSGATGAQLLVKLPNALKSIDSDRIIVKNGPSGVTYLAGAQWADTVPRMVQAKLIEAFENKGTTGATAKPGDGLVIDYQMISDIRRFEISEAGVATIEMSIKLLSDKSGKVLETRIFSAQSTAVGSDASAYVASFDAAFAELSRSVISWVLARV